MNLAFAAAIASILLIVTSQISRRKRDDYPWLDWVVRGLTVIVITLVAAYFYQRAAA